LYIKHALLELFPGWLRPFRIGNGSVYLCYCNMFRPTPNTDINYMLGSKRPPIGMAHAWRIELSRDR